MLSSRCRSVSLNLGVGFEESGKRPWGRLVVIILVNNAIDVIGVAREWRSSARMILRAVLVTRRSSSSDITSSLEVSLGQVHKDNVDEIGVIHCLDIDPLFIFIWRPRRPLNVLVTQIYTEILLSSVLISAKNSARLPMVQLSGPSPLKSKIERRSPASLEPDISMACDNFGLQIRGHLETLRF
jgi:hypothetical protein